MVERCPVSTLVINILQTNAETLNFFNMKVRNSHFHESYTCFLQNVVTFSFAGITHFSSVFKYGGALSSLHLLYAMQIKTKA